ncbi:MAG TPA: TetR/AcrR family transcriptional regulator [Candidatus Marinimicrobia bacterium]|jgi:AcrR family transcriptional regulator|nr:TetR/AcrR family transcriptional regulator [Candidatus Neomarinimicrobiota bacterium]HIB26027.1 TetR/AcrR family transcriptional regulator [Candidatus Neomarinimicrobiota bacterium]HIB34182.1 TetR/AcrR family transcriptional regulator [Candidatus Neomarinimicrobiota bacterium]
MNQTKQDLRKDQILDAALTVLVQNGYEGSRMDDVVSKSQLSKGAIYWYYKSKKDMYLDLVNFWVIRYSATINHLVENDQAAPDQLKSLFNYFIDQYESDPDPFIALTEFWSMAQKDDDFRAKLQKVYSQFLEVLEKIVAKGVKDDDFKKLDIRITAMSIMLNVESINWFTLFDTHGVSARDYIQTISDFILAGLLKKT